MKSGSRSVAFGTRSLSIAAGVDHSTVAAHLRELRAEQDPFIVLLENDRGLAGDLYELRIPDGVAGRADRAAWPAGRMHALRPAFRELGLPSAVIYEALETSGGPLSSFELAQAAGISRSAAYDALETLVGWDLITPDGRGRWLLVRTTCLDRLAEAWGVLDTIRGLITPATAVNAPTIAAPCGSPTWPAPTSHWPTGPPAHHQICAHHQHRRACEVPPGGWTSVVGLLVGLLGG